MNSLCVLRTASRSGSALTGATVRALLVPPGPVFSDIEVRGQAVPAALPAVARLLIPAERARRIEPVIRVRPDHPRSQALRRPQDPAALLGPDPGRQPV